MAKKYSKEQLSAIETRDRTLLVSAAAGSGKTTTLTERIIRSLFDEKNPESISDMLIVTFTNAAVADMREKIGKALAKAINENPENKRIEKELYLLPSARICTIDSFCNEILRSNAERVGISPSYRIAESAEATILSSSLLDSLINEIYEGELTEVATPVEFEELCDSLTDSKQTGKLAELFRLLYGKTTSTIEGVSIFRNIANKFGEEKDLSPELSTYGGDLMTLYRETLTHYANVFRGIIEQFTESEDQDSAAFSKDLDSILSALSAKTYIEVRDNLNSFAFARLPQTKDKSDFLLFAREEREKIKDDLAKFKSKFFAYNAEEWKKLFENLHKILSTLASFLELFDKLYVEEKMRRGMLEHSDIERLAYFCLYDKNGEKTDIANSYSKLFSSVYIDEYQDVNALQNAIFEAVSSTTNRFMVGDIKQSIYRFRSAKPEIFARMKSSYPPLEKSTPESGASIFMSRNYRCDKGIVDFVNDIFDRAFSVSKESIGYVDEDRLVYSKVYDDYPEPFYTPAKLVILPKSQKDKANFGDSLDDILDEEENIPLSEARWIARRIKDILKNEKLADGNKVSPGDIAILLRKNNSIEVFSEALLELGIASESRDNKNFFLNAEVLLTLCLLNAIDNPSKDVYLAGLMCSPLYDFTPDDLVKIRKASSGGRLYLNVKEYSENHPEDKKLSSFLADIAKYREIAEGMNVDALISRLYRETGLLALASKHGGKDNLMLLYNYARKFEGSTYKGLYNFINYINNVIDSNAEFEGEKRGTGRDDCVKIVTVHSSKGLEYPIVFFAESAKKFTNLDKRNKFAYSEDYGLSVYLRASGGLALIRNPIQHLIHENMDKKYIEEELRVLYVALTRAREQLYIVGTSPDEDREAFLFKENFYSKILTAYSQRKTSSFLEIILTSITDKADIILPDSIDDAEIKRDTGEAENIKKEEKEQQGKEQEEEKKKTSSESKKKDSTALADELSERFSFVYPDSSLADLPEKMSVSRLYPTVLDGSLDRAKIFTPPEDSEEKEKKGEKKRKILPAFYTGSEDDESRLRGIATHTVLQFFDISNLEKNGTDKELQRLLDEGFISKENLDRVRRNEIELFAKSELFSDMKRAKKLYREFRFNSRLPASLFTTKKKDEYEDTDILVQGVIDCIIEDEDGNIRLIDYKTDRLKEKELSNKNLALDKLTEKHSLQLFYYSLAVEKIFGKAPCSVGIYSLPLGEFLEIDITEKSQANKPCDG